jgi:hypothetical protein
LGASHPRAAPARISARQRSFASRAGTGACKLRLSADALRAIVGARRRARPSAPGVRAARIVPPPASARRTIALVRIPWSTRRRRNIAAEAGRHRRTFWVRLGAALLCCSPEFAMFRIGQHCCPNWWPIARSGILAGRARPAAGGEGASEAAEKQPRPVSGTKVAFFISGSPWSAALCLPFPQAGSEGKARGSRR